MQTKLRINHLKLNIIQEGEKIVVLSHMKPSPDNVGFALVHMFLFNNDKIVEMWDIGTTNTRRLAKRIWNVLIKNNVALI